MELDASFFEKYSGVTKATTDPRLRLEREMFLAQLWKKYGPPKDSLEATIAEMRANVAASVAAAKRLEARLEKSNGSVYFAPMAGAGAHQMNARNMVDTVPRVDTSRQRFLPDSLVEASASQKPMPPVGDVLNVSGSLQEALLHAHDQADERQTSEVETSPSRPWPSADRRDLSSRTDVLADAAKSATAGDDLVKAAHQSARAAVEPEIARYHGERIGTESLRCTICDHKILAKTGAPAPMKRLEDHFNRVHGADTPNLVTVRHDVPSQEDMAKAAKAGRAHAYDALAKGTFTGF